MNTLLCGTNGRCEGIPYRSLPFFSILCGQAGREAIMLSKTVFVYSLVLPCLMILYKLKKP